MKYYFSLIITVLKDIIEHLLRQYSIQANTVSRLIQYPG